jgi:ABC-type Fe3+/spermidine/putrescine transport system ATPase subunit
VEIGTPTELYRSPKTLFTARFLGNTSIIRGVSSGCEVRLPWGQVVRSDRSVEGEVDLSIRPEDFSIRPSEQGSALVTGAQFLGASIRYRLSAGDHQVMASVPGRDSVLPSGTRVELVPLAPLHVLENGGA